MGLFCSCVPLWRCRSIKTFKRAFTTGAAGKVYVLGHDGDTLGVDGAQVGALEHTKDDVGLGSVVKGVKGQGW